MSSKRQSLLLDFVPEGGQSLDHTPSSSSSVTLTSPIRRSKSSSSPTSRASTLLLPSDPPQLPSIQYPIPQDSPSSLTPPTPPLTQALSSHFVVQIRYQRGSNRLRCSLVVHSGMTVRQGVESACRFFGLTEDWNFCFWDGRSSSWLHDWLSIDSYPLGVLDSLFVRGKSADYHEPSASCTSFSSPFDSSLPQNSTIPPATSLTTASTSSASTAAGARRNKSFSTRISSSSLGQLLFSRKQPFELRLRPHTLYLCIALFDPQDRLLMTPTGLLPTLPIVSADVFKDMGMEVEGDTFAWIARTILTWGENQGKLEGEMGKAGSRSSACPNLGQGLSSPSLHTATSSPSNPQPSSRWSPLSLLPGRTNRDSIESVNPGVASSSASISSSSSSASTSHHIILPPAHTTHYPQEESPRERLETMVREVFPSVLADLLRILGLDQPGYLHDLPMALPHVQDSRLILLHQYAGPRLRRALEGDDVVKKGNVRWRLPERLDDATYGGAFSASFRSQCIGSSMQTRKRSSSNPGLAAPTPDPQAPSPTQDSRQTPALLSPPTSPTRSRAHGKTPWDGGGPGHASTSALDAMVVDLIPGPYFNNFPTFPPPYHLHHQDKEVGKGRTSRNSPSPTPPSDPSDPSFSSRPYPMWREILSGLHARSSSLGGGLYLGLMYTENTLQSINMLLPKRRRTLPPLVKIRDSQDLSEEEVAWMICVHSGAHTLPGISLSELTASVPATSTSPSQPHSRSHSTSGTSYVSTSASSCHSTTESSYGLVGSFAVEFTLAYRLLQQRTQLDWSPKDIYTHGTISVDAAGLRLASDPIRPCHARIILIVKPMRPVQDGLDRTFDRSKFDMYPLPLFETLHLHTQAPLETRRIGRLTTALQGQLQDRKAQLLALQRAENALAEELNGVSSPTAGNGEVNSGGSESDADHRMSLAELFASPSASPAPSCRPSLSFPISRSSSRSSRTATTPESSFLVGEVERLAEEIHLLRAQSTANLWTREIILWDRNRQHDRLLPNGGTPLLVSCHLFTGYPNGA
ncbi:hypothetical protein BJ684DRAFT_15144 [Piptocephalis cylindrospora]|uniref:Uncharacterized protein n=1 Tax=Piptocephalis cylindrospora TaxID=1907219 RepID=A0A4P9Y953_9FUNG|nr:hypothetical protein BJ684DRAFT_15144 [Piptocephalis cylindrospora]|eukprot:RKP14530.1 hypothetical protein BJ684DRAFT_15144 [Piptocephalis cylindrospora]